MSIENTEPEFKMTGRQKTAMIYKYLKPYLPLFLAAILFACLEMAVHAITPQIVRFSVDEILEKNIFEKPLQILFPAAIGILITASLRGLCSYLRRVELAKGSESFVKALRDALFRHIQYLPFAWHKQNPTGDIIQRCTSDLDVIRNFVCNQLVEVIRTVFLIILYLSIMFSMHFRLSLAAAAFIPIVGLSSAIFYKKISWRFKNADEAEGELTTTVQENLTGIRVVRAFGRERFEEKKFREKNDSYAGLWLHLGKLLSVYWASGTFLTCLQVMVIVVLGVVECVNHGMSIGTFLAFISYNEALTWPVRSLGRILSDMSKAGVSLDRVGYILQAEEEHDAENSADCPDGDIVFSHVTFSYEEKEVLKDVSFTIKEGETFAVLGGTGSGKSTLLHLLDRLYDLPEEKGSITIGGVNLRNIRRDSLRKHIALILQEPFLFSQTIRENIRAVSPHADEDEIRHFAEIACVDDAITAFQDGYDTIVGEKGVTLSGGQRQRVAIARMLMQKAKVMVFDDSLSAVDTETDSKIRQALKETMHHATVLLISHRITTLMQADRILVLDKGRVAALGTHHELVKIPGLYREIYELQMNRDDRLLLEEGGIQ